MKVTQIHDFGHKTSLNCKEKGYSMFLHDYCTGKYLSEALILASTNPQYDDRLFIELRVQYMKSASSVENMLRTCCVHKLIFCVCFDSPNNLCAQHVLI